MTTFTIQIRDKDRDLFEQLAKRSDVKIIEVVDDNTQPNNATKKAIADARAGKTKKMDDIDLFFKNL